MLHNESIGADAFDLVVNDGSTVGIAGTKWAGLAFNQFWKTLTMGSHSLSHNIATSSTSSDWNFESKKKRLKADLCTPWSFLRWAPPLLMSNWEFWQWFHRSFQMMRSGRSPVAQIAKAYFKARSPVAQITKTYFKACLKVRIRAQGWESPVAQFSVVMRFG